MLMLVPFFLLFTLTISTEVTLKPWKYRFDSDGNLLDAHDGKLYYFEEKYYLYGTAYNCGFRWRTANFTSPFCGFKSYSSTNMKVWKDEGFLFNANTTEWQGRCAYEAACFRPKVLQNPKTKEYIMWMNEGAAEYSYTTFTSSHPTGPFVEKAQPVMAYARGSESYGNGDFGITIGPNGTGYIVYDTTPVVSTHGYLEISNITFGIVQELSDDYTSTKPNWMITGNVNNIEAWDMFYRGGWWYLTFGHICGYCTATDTSYIKSKSPWGPWLEENRVRLTNTSCGGQNTMASQIPTNANSSGLQDTWIIGSDLWTGDVNEGKAGLHWEPLRFLPNGDIEPISCNAQEYHTDIPVSESPVKDVVEDAAVHSTTGDFNWNCGFGIQAKSILFQFFQATKTGNVTEFGVNVAQQANNADMSMSLIQVTSNIGDLYTTQGRTDSLWGGTYPVANIGWSFPMVKGQPNVTVTEGTWYGIQLSSRAASIPYCYLERNTSAETGGTRSFMAEQQQGRYPLTPIPGKEMRFYLQIE
ncbi:hypothetical protein NA57DRAFT_80404 [Rhizodiscina lignyota]|uniref:Uncharacterized protein n=1 Tax=Rhizodiscina lignyota TaxID=1504668 RepID=A0A9P4I8F8_9PEZI|nr:hypothetical protein NA57DRAFT_80404 [Rhizodiscina lignyota]